jgi:hypothetical protein
MEKDIKYISFKLGKNIIKFRKNTFKYVLIIVVTLFVLLPYADFNMPVHFLSDL